MNLPDLARARQVWLTNPRLVVGGTLATAVAALLALASIGSDSGRTLTLWILLLQNIVLFFYGVPAAVNDFVEEHRNNTWDMLRLTPLTAAEIVFGRLAASTSYAVFLAAVLAPWALFAQNLQGAPGLLTLAAQWGAMTLGFAATAATGIAAAALAARIQAGRVGNAGLAMGGLGFLASGYTQFMAISNETVPLLFGPVPGFAYFSLALAAGAFWGATAAVRLVGRLLSERQAPWGLPAFMATVWALLALWVPGGRGAEIWDSLCITVPAVIAVLAAFAEGEGSEDWRANLRLAERRRSWLPLLPTWAPQLATVALLAALTLVVRPEAARMAGMSVFFLARDLSILGALRLAVRRNVEALAMALLGGGYILPMIYFAATDGRSSIHWVIPMEAPALGVAANAAPGALQALAAAALLAWAVRRTKKEPGLLR